MRRRGEARLGPSFGPRVGRVGVVRHGAPSVGACPALACPALNPATLSLLPQSIAKDYEVLIEDGPDAGVALRGLFLISPTGALRQKTVNDLPVGRSVDETLRLVQAFQFADEHGEVCPAGWTPGAATIVPEVAASKKYFEAAAAADGAGGGKKRKA